MEPARAKGLARVKGVISSDGIGTPASPLKLRRVIQMISARVTSTVYIIGAISAAGMVIVAGMVVVTGATRIAGTRSWWCARYLTMYV